MNENVIFRFSILLEGMVRMLRHWFYGVHEYMNHGIELKRKHVLIINSEIVLNSPHKSMTWFKSWKVCNNDYVLTLSLAVRFSGVFRFGCIQIFTFQLWRSVFCDIGEHLCKLFPSSFVFMSLFSSFSDKL